MYIKQYCEKGKEGRRIGEIQGKKVEKINCLNALLEVGFQ